MEEEVGVPPASFSFIVEFYTLEARNSVSFSAKWNLTATS